MNWNEGKQGTVLLIDGEKNETYNQGENIKGDISFIWW